MSVKLNVSLNSAVAQNKEHLLEMLKRQSVSAVYDLIKLYTVKLRKMQNNMRNIYKYAKMKQNMWKYAKMQKQ